MHKENIVHRYVRLPNVIIKDNHELALIDFVLARYIDNEKYMKQEDYWYIGDFLIHLYYSSYIPSSKEEKPWYEELDLNKEESIFLKKLMGIEEEYDNIEQVREQLEILKKTNED